MRTRALVRGVYPAASPSRRCPRLKDVWAALHNIGGPAQPLEAGLHAAEYKRLLARLKDVGRTALRPPTAPAGGAPIPPWESGTPENLCQGPTQRIIRVSGMGPPFQVTVSRDGGVKAEMIGTRLF